MQLGHGKGNDTPIETLNRGFEKCVRMTLGDETAVVPQLRRENVEVLLEELATEMLAVLAQRPARDAARSVYPLDSIKHFKRKVRITKDIPVIVASFKGREYLLDGNRRVHYWTEMGAASMQAYVCRIS